MAEPNSDFPEYHLSGLPERMPSWAKEWATMALRVRLHNVDGDTLRDYLHTDLLGAEVVWVAHRLKEVGQSATLGPGKRRSPT